MQRLQYAMIGGCVLLLGACSVTQPSSPDVTNLKRKLDAGAGM